MPARIRRLPYALPSLSASWSSSPVRAVTRASMSAAVGAAGRSIRPPQVAGWSRASTVPSPQTAAWYGAVTSPGRSVATAPPVTAQSGAVTPAPASSWATASVATVPRASTGCAGSGRSSMATSDSTPSKTPSRTASRRAAGTDSAVASGRVTLAVSARACKVGSAGASATVMVAPRSPMIAASLAPRPDASPEGVMTSQCPVSGVGARSWSRCQDVR